MAIEKYVAKDFTAAIDATKKAIALQPKHALGHYVLGEIYLAVGNLSEAEAAFLAAEEASDFKSPSVRPHVLFAVADVYERQKKWEKAMTAWQAYAAHATKLRPDGGAHPRTSLERIAVIKRAIELEKAYAPVRERIAAEKPAPSAGKRAVKK